jgi:putative phage-type endonuclease
MPIINIIAGSQEWLDFRKTHITSTDASIINGTNTFGGNSPRKLWERKIGLIPEEPLNERMIEGSAMEAEARDWYNKTHNTNFQPETVVHDEHEWAMATLDGFYEDTILEIKCGKKAFEQAQAGILPDYYYDQIQHAMFCKGVRKAVYCAFRREEEPVVMQIEAHDEYMAKLFGKEDDFYINHLCAMIPPEASDDDFEEIIDDDKLALADEWTKAKVILEEAQRMEKEAKERLLDGLEKRKYQCGNVRIGCTTKRGDIDWKRVVEELGTSQEELDNCRRKPTTFFVVKRID